MNHRIVILIFIALGCFSAAAMVMAQDMPINVPEAASEMPLARDISPMHPTFLLLDTDGNNVTITDNPVSTMVTCGVCHDTAFISSHTKHGDGGSLAAGALPPDQIAPVSAEMNCFLCHAAAPNNEARISALDSGQQEWASAAVLVGSGIVQQTENGFSYNAEAFNAEGELKREYITLRDPQSENCGACHGLVHTDNQTPLALAIGDETQWRTFVTGHVISPQRISASGVNLHDRQSVDRSWDVHNERVLNCVDCHYSVFNPVYTRANVEARLSHLIYDPRRADLGEYLLRPSHEFAAGTDTMRSCDTCHEAQDEHAWLPYWEQHTNTLACETCHIPQLYAPALAARDATVIHLDGSPVDQYRGFESAAVMTLPADPTTVLISGYQPVLLQQVDEDGSQQLSPYNLVALWYWAAGEPAQPITSADLRAAYLQGEGYAPDVLAAFDADSDGALSDIELSLDTEAKISLITSRLAVNGLQNPHIVGELNAYPIHHNVTGGEWATRDCQTCHSDQSLLTTTMSFGNRTPGGVTPSLPNDQRMRWNGTLNVRDNTGLTFTPDTQTSAATLYIFGHDSVEIIDTLGVLLVLFVSLGVIIHATLRVVTGRRHAAHAKIELRHEYMYSLYERQWHWLQTFVIFGLTFTGLVVHRPAMFPLFSFAWMVDVHNVFAILLVINAVLALFYHLASGEIKQFVPRPYGFFDDMMQQALYYLRGIFRGDPHPFEKRRDRKMNPIQQLTYLALLNVLLPLQILTGVLMWGAQQFPQLTAILGGLPVLAPFHTLIAWLLVAFVIVHVYMTTTGHTAMANIRAMVMGYDDVEIHSDTEHGTSGSQPAETTI
jgi:thiosulfate reductase cytochrome b subunit